MLPQPLLGVDTEAMKRPLQPGIQDMVIADTPQLASLHMSQKEDMAVLPHQPENELPLQTPIQPIPMVLQIPMVLRTPMVPKIRTHRQLGLPLPTLPPPAILTPLEMMVMGMDTVQPQQLKVMMDTMTDIPHLQQEVPHVVEEDPALMMLHLVDEEEAGEDTVTAEAVEAVVVIEEVTAVVAVAVEIVVDHGELPVVEVTVEPPGVDRGAQHATNHTRFSIQSLLNHRHHRGQRTR